MRKILLLIFLLLVCGGKAKAQAVQTCIVAGSGTSGSTIPCTFTNPLGAHHAIAIEGYWGNTPTVLNSVSSTLGLSYTILNSGYINSGGGGVTTAIAYLCDTGAGGTETITLNISPASSFRYLVAIEVSGRATVGCLDGASDHKAQSTAGSVTATSGNSTTTNASDLMVAFFGYQGGCTTWTAQSDGSGHNYIIPANGKNLGVAVQYLTENSIGTYNASITCNASSPWNAHLLAFLPSGSSPGPAPPLAINVAPNCTSMSTCTYTDTAVPPGQHFYFAIAVNTQSLSSVGSNSFNVTVPSGTHNVVLNWTPSASGPSGISYTIYRGAPPTNVTIGKLLGRPIFEFQSDIDTGF